MNILHLDSSMLGNSSITRELSAAVVAGLRAQHPSAHVTYRDLVHDEIRHLTGPIAAGFRQIGVGALDDATAREHELYLGSFGMDNHKLRFIQLMHCLEACLNTSVPDPAAHITARHASALISSDKAGFRLHYFEVVELYKIRNELIYEDLSGTARLTLLEKEVECRMDTLDKMIRTILKKLIGLNYQKKEQLIEELELLTF